MSKEVQQYTTEHGGDDAIRLRMIRNGDDGTGDVLEWLKSSAHAPQEDRILAMEALRTISELPPEHKRMAYKMCAGANVIECAKEIGISIDEAISLQKRVRFLTEAFEEIPEVGR